MLASSGKAVGDLEEHFTEKRRKKIPIQQFDIESPPQAKIVAFSQAPNPDDVAEIRGKFMR